MSALSIFIVLLSGSLLAGFLGALSGLGGGLIIVPLLVLFMDVDIHYAIGASLMAVIATSSGSSVAYVKEGYTNIRVGVLLETATTLGAITGVAIGTKMPVDMLYLAFGLILLYSGISSFFNNGNGLTPLPPSKIANFFKLDSNYPIKGTYQSYHVQHVPLGYCTMYIAGALSGILGIGAGVLKVVALDKIMHLPFKVSTTTSNFMIGVTAAASAGIYLALGYIDPFLTMPIVLGVTLGALLGARLLPILKTKILRILFACLVIFIAGQMIVNGLHIENYLK